MPTACQSIPSPDSLAPGMMAYLDCQARTLGAQGYQALAAPGSVASVVLTGMLTLLIAVFGYRLLLGYVPNIRDGVLTFVKIGLVLTLATSWPAYQILIYDVVLRTPAELAAGIGSPAGLPGTTGGLAVRLDAIDRALATLAIEGVGTPLSANTIPTVAPPLAPGFDSFALGWARVGFLVSALASFAVVRIVAGLLLALGPLFAVFLLFDGTRGLFGGWLRGLVGVALAALAISIVLGVELAFLEPWLATLLSRRTADLDILGAPAQLLAVMLIFGVALGAVMLVLGKVALGLRIPAWNLRGIKDQIVIQSNGSSLVTSHGNGPSIESRSRAAAVADAVAITQRQEAASNLEVARVTQSGGTTASGGRSRGSVVSPIGMSVRSVGRRTSHRISQRSARRDRTL